MIISCTLAFTLSIPTNAHAEIFNSNSSLSSMFSSLKVLITELKNTLAKLPQSSFRAQVIPPTNGLIGHLKFDESSGTTASDASGNGNTGTLVNGPTWVSGAVAGAVQFDGIDDKISLGNLSSTLFSGDFAFSAWVYHKSNVTKYVFGKHIGSGDNVALFVRASGATSRYEFRIDQSKGADVVGTYSDRANKWEHVVVTRTGSLLNLYVNGVSNGSAESSEDGSNTADFILGDALLTNAAPWDGIMDDIRIYNQGLSPEEVSNIYNTAKKETATSGSTQTPIPTTLPATVSAPLISSFSASPTSITSGNSTTLSWSVSGATSVSINQGVGTVTGTSKSVSPATNTIYTLTAVNAVGSVTANVPIIVSNGATPVAPIAIAPIVGGAAPRPVGNGITIKDMSNSTQINRPHSISRVFKQGEIRNFPQARVNGNNVSTQADVKSRWPDGSVKHVVASFLATIPANASIAVDFINQSSGNNDGGMTKAEMLAYGGGSWDAEIETTIGSANARAMLSDWDGNDTGLNGKSVRYWLKGPIVTQVIVEDKTPSLRYDFGSNNYKSLHPIFVLTFYPGTDLGVKVEYILENMWTTKLQDQEYALTLKANDPAPTTVYTKPLFTHIGQTRWHKTFWSGQEPKGWINVGNPGVTINYNFPYITSTYVLPNFDQSITVPKSVADSIVSRFRASERDIKGKALWGYKGFGSLDDHSESTDVPEIYALYLYTFDPGLYEVLLGQADVSGYIPIHLRESATDKSYDSTKTINAFSLPLSLNARPTYRSKTGISSLGIPSAGPLSVDGWNPDAGHQPSFAYVPYLITGDWYYLDEINFWSSYNLAMPIGEYRHNDWGFFQRIQLRGEARALRTLGHSAFISPDNSYEKAYYTEKLHNNIAIREGQYDIKDGSFYEPCTTSPFNEKTETSKWCWGRNSEYVAGGRSNPLYLPWTLITDTPSITSGMEADKVHMVTSQWHNQYNHIAYSHLVELGFPIKKLRDATILNLLGQLASPDYNPNLIILIEGMPGLRKSDKQYFDNWGAMKDAFVDSLENRTSIPVNDAYAVEARAAATYLPGINSGSMSGQAAWEWISARASVMSTKSKQVLYPQWAYLPRNTFVSSDKIAPSTPTGLSILSTSATSTHLSWSSATDNVGVLGYRIYRNGSQIAISGSPSYIDTSLTPSTTYNYTVVAYDTANNISNQSSPVSYTTSAFIQSNDRTPTTKLPVTIPTPPIKTPPPPSASSTTTTTPDQSSGTRRGSRRSSGSSPTANIPVAKNSCTPLTLPRNVAFGSQGSDVTTLQNFLVTNGFTTADNVTGYYGLATESAIKAFQRQYAIVSSGDPMSTGYGVAGAMTRAKIQELTKCTSGATRIPTTPVVLIPTPYTLLVRGLALGTRGDDVTMLQNLLLAQGFLTADNVTGYYGYATQVAVQGFQRKFNIVSSGTPDTTGYGAVGPATRVKLNGFLNSTASPNKNATQKEMLQKQVEMLLLEIQKLLKAKKETE